MPDAVRSRVVSAAAVAVLALALVLAPRVVHAAVVEVINDDGPGEGLNDATPASPVGGNAGTTLGAQRLIALQAAAAVWGGLLSSDVTVRIEASFDPLACNATSAALGSAGPSKVFRDFPGAPVPNTWYHAALANKLRGLDLDPTSDDVEATFSSSLGTTCAFPASWYYGLDGSPAADQVDLLTVALHELGHGLGFLTFVDLGTGSKLAGFDDAYMRSLEEHATGKLYPDMTDSERVMASTDTGNLHWVGPAVVANSGGLTSGRDAAGHVEIYAPDPQEPGLSVGHFSNSLSPNELMEPSYTGRNHDVGLARHLMTDLGWGPSACGDGLLDAGEQCDDGNASNGDCCSNACQFELEGVRCEDGDACTARDTCDGAGTCVPGPPPNCDDGNACTEDSCNPGSGCVLVPTTGPCDDGSVCTTGDACAGGTCVGVATVRTGCRRPTRPASSTLQLKDGAADARDSLLWKWLSGEATAVGDFGDPLALTDFSLCIFDESAGSPTLLLGATAPAGGTCGADACWSPAGTRGFKYKDREATPDGLGSLRLRSGESGTAKVGVKGKGANLPLPGLPVPEPAKLRAQLQASNGECWEATYSPVGVIKNEPGQFKGRAD